MSNITDVVANSLARFLLDRIAEDRATDMGLEHRPFCRGFGGWPGDPSSVVPCDCTIGRRVEAESSAKQAIVEAATETLSIPCNGYPADHSGCDEAHSMAFFALRALAGVYEGHGDFDERWSL